MSRVRNIMFASVAVLLLGVGIVYANTERTISPLVHEQKMHGLAANWGNQMQLPAYVPDHYDLRQAEVVEVNGVKLLRIDLDMLTIQEHRTSTKTVEQLAFGQQPGETIKDTIERVKKQPKNVSSGGFNEILEMESVNIGSGTGYSYKLDQHFAISEELEFIQDGTQIRLSTDRLSKEELIKIAKSFKAEDLQ